VSFGLFYCGKGRACTFETYLRAFEILFLYFSQCVVANFFGSKVSASSFTFGRMSE
jgi:hypothetical protein